MRFKFATVALGDALSSLRAAKQFARSADQRSALAELEIAILRQIRVEADTNFRGAAMMFADSKVKDEFVQARIRRIEDMRARYASLPDNDAKVAEAYRNAYADEMKEVVKLTDPRSPPKCAFDQWRPLNEAAIRAEAKQ